jgi:nucleoside-diphosphate-sugar epimerase
MADSLIEGMDIVIQAAAVTSGCKDTFERPWIHVTDNAVMNAYILRSAFLHKVKHVIYFSCSTMYGGGHCAEDTPINPNPKYLGMVSTKLYNEKMCEFYAGLGETKYTVVRGSNFYGPYDKFGLDRAHVFGATVTKVLQATDSIEVWGDGSEARDICYVDDLVNFVECALEKQKENFGLYNVGFGEAFTIKNIVEKIIAASGKRIDIKFDTSKPSIQVSTSLNCEKATRDLGWVTNTSLPAGIVKTLAWVTREYT